MKIISWNVNGIRAVLRYGFMEWFKKTNPDILCLQEIKANPEQLPENLVKTKNYHSYFNPASKKGYSGVAVYVKEKPKAVKNKLGLKRFGQEGRFLELEFSDFVLINIYIPQGGRQKENMGYKLKVYDYLLSYLKKLNRKKLILLGDFNVAHQEIDLARPKQNQKNTMFTPEERKKLDKLIDLGFTDTFRALHKEGGHYTWWPYFAPNARDRNLGWRIDYVFVSKNLDSKINKAFILPKVKGSDHAPVGIELH